MEEWLIALTMPVTSMQSVVSRMVYEIATAKGDSRVMDKTVQEVSDNYGHKNKIVVLPSRKISEYVGSVG